MDFLKSWQFAVGLIVTFALVMVVLVIAGVLSHHEPGLMPNAPHWKELPVRVLAKAYAGESTEAVREVDAAIHMTNGRLGFQAFRLVTEHEEPQVEVTVGVPSEVGWSDPGGNATFGLSHGKSFCCAKTSNVHGELLGLVLQHEFGHCLGLDHDDYEQSIMRRTQRETPMGSIPPWISDSDRALLRAIYAR